MNFSIKNQVFIPLLGSLFLGVILCGGVFYQAVNSQNSAQELVQKITRVESYTQEMQAEFTSANDLVRTVLAMSQFIEQEEITKNFNETSTALAAAIEGLQANSLSSEMQEMGSELMSSYQEWHTITSVILGVQPSSQIPTHEKIERSNQTLRQLILDISQTSKINVNESIVLSGQKTQQSLFIVLGIALVIALVGAIGAHFLATNISRPLVSLVKNAEKLAAGDTDTTFSEQNRSDEIGAVARAISGFRDGVLERAQLEEKANAEKKKQALRQTRVEKLIENFSQASSSNLNAFEDRLNKMRDEAQGLTKLATASHQKAQTANDASVETATDVQLVSHSSDAVANSIDDISQKLSQTNDVITQANKESNTANDKVAALSEAAEKIGDVISLIKDVTEQTNLLALNATIEAARAGEAGKGFAVVAGEVKALASQTTKAAEDISLQITQVQTSTQSVTSAIGQITGTMQDVSQYAEKITQSVEIQKTSTSDIQDRVRRASEQTQTVNSNIESVTDAIKSTNQVAIAVEDITQSTSEDLQKLKQSIEAFLNDVSAA